jgi:hypothetical protein
LKVTFPPHVDGAVHVKLHEAPAAQVGEQFVHMPLVPHAAAAVPIAHVEPLQHPPLHGDVALQLVEHVDAVHAWFAGQSLAVEHVVTHALLVHACFWLQVLHARPPEPHAVDDSSVWHVPSVAQQPAAHVDGPQEGPVSAVLPSVPPSAPPSGPASEPPSGPASCTPASPPSGVTLPSPPPSGDTLASPPSFGVVPSVPPSWCTGASGPFVTSASPPSPSGVGRSGPPSSALHPAVTAMNDTVAPRPRKREARMA